MAKTRVKVRLQTDGGVCAQQSFKGPIHCLMTTVRKEGFFALYKGATPPLVGWAITDSLQVGTYTNLANIIEKNIQWDFTDINYGVHALAGIGGGWASSITATPMEQIKARLQVQQLKSASITTYYSGPIDCARQLIQKKGFVKGLWTGFGATLLFRSHFGIFWPSYHYVTNSLKNQNFFGKLHPVFISFLSGGTAATAFWVVAFPSDLIKNRIMSQPISVKPQDRFTIRSVATSIYRSQGIKGFYRGFLPGILRSFPTNGAALLVYERIMHLGSSTNRQMEN